MKIPFAFSLTDADEYGTPFAFEDDAFGSTAELNSILASIDDADQTPPVFGLTLPPTDRAYKITAVEGLVSSDADDDVEFGIWDGAAFIVLYLFVDGQGSADFGDGFTVASGYIPAFRYTGAGSSTVTGQIAWRSA